jgi:hypothetical protein
MSWRSTVSFSSPRRMAYSVDEARGSSLFFPGKRAAIAGTPPGYFVTTWYSADSWSIRLFSVS